MTKKVVLDASAVLAYLQDESGSEKVDAVLTEGKSTMSAVNYAEVVGKLFEAGLHESSVQVVMENLEYTLNRWMKNKHGQQGCYESAPGNLVCH